LKKLDIKVIEGFNPKNIPADADLIIASAAYLGQEIKNPEVAEVKKQGRPIFTYAQILGQLFQEKKGIAVAGTHGKSTITAMLGLILEEAGFDPTVIVGSRVIQWQSNARVGQSEYLVAEADEYRNNFLEYRPQILILSSLEYDHPDFFEDFQAYQETFRQLVRKIPSAGFIIANSLDKQVKEAVKGAECQVIEYGLPKEKIKLKIPGRHNLLNAAAALETALKLGIDKEIVKKSLVNFRGISRRFEIKDQWREVLLIDDYAHHPTEIKATLAAAKEFYPERKIWAVFQPHTFSRTEALLDDFAASFEQADQVIILDIYGSAREPAGQVKAADLVEKIRENVRRTPSAGASLKRASLCHTIEEAVEYLKRNVQAGQIILAMGAGDVWQVLEKIKR